MIKIWSIAIITFKEGLRQRLLYGVIVASLLLIFVSVFISGLFMRDILKVLLDLCLSAISVGGLLVPFFLAINLLAGDIDKRTIYTLLSRNISRPQYILGKYLGLAMITATVMATLLVATLIAQHIATFIYPDYFFTKYTIRPVLISTAMSYLGIMVFTSTVILWCTITTSSFLATLLTLSTYLIGHTAEDMVRFMIMRNTAESFTPAIEYTVKAALYIFPNLASFDLKLLSAHSLALPFDEISLLVLYASAYISIMLILAIRFFQRRDLP
ncbi:ABC transporter permease [Desulfosediminicola sp.]|uniref:ABC transporter permease n=1 Tax=Desulfosediminicola sp. TaxID=2886825 RepID=UPI003AF2B437